MFTSCPLALAGFMSTQVQVILVEGASIEKMPLSGWPGGEGPVYWGQRHHSWADAPGQYKKAA